MRPAPEAPILTFVAAFLVWTAAVPLLVEEPLALLASLFDAADG